MFWVWCEIVCIDCGDSIAGTHVSGARVPRREMKAEAVRHGWTFNKNGDAHCGCLTPTQENK